MAKDERPGKSGRRKAHYEKYRNQGRELRNKTNKLLRHVKKQPMDEGAVSKLNSLTPLPSDLRAKVKQYNREECIKKVAKKRQGKKARKRAKKQA